MTPLGGGSDAQFDGEFRLMFNWFYGRNRNPLRRPVQF